MLYAKRQYVTELMAEENTAWVLEINWLHNNFNRQFLRSEPSNKVDGVHLWDNPTMYMVKKALGIIERRRKSEDIYQIMHLTVIFYYATHLLLLNGSKLTEREWDLAKTVKRRCMEAMEDNHKDRIADNTNHIDALIENITDANQLRKQLKYGWEAHEKAKEGGTEL